MALVIDVSIGVKYMFCIVKTIINMASFNLVLSLWNDHEEFGANVFITNKVKVIGGNICDFSVSCYPKYDYSNP